MKFTTLGNTALNVSMFCIGGQSFGTRDKEELVHPILDRYVEAGGNFLDTANMYATWLGQGGESETLLGAWMKQRENRNRMVVASKVGFAARDAPQSTRAEDIVRECDRSLERLQTDRIDLYYAHRDDRQVPLEEQLRAFDRMVQAGKVRYIGASNFKAWRLAEAAGISTAENLSSFCCVQQRFTYLRPRVDADFDFQTSCNDDLLEYCKFRDLPLLAYSPLLSGAYGRDDRRIPGQYLHADTDARLAALNAVASKTGSTLNQVILAWLTGQGILPVTGASTLDQLAESLAGFDLTLSKDQMETLNNAGAS
jgi:aryl-alcohol dehydrogenase-like predicted oxidoreductase